MGWLNRVRRALADVFAPDRVEREVDEELQAFLDLDARDRERAGASPAEARRAARASFGGVEAAREHARDGRFWTGLESVWRDVRSSVRGLVRQPSSTGTAIVTIALGTLPLAATAGLANWLFFAPAPGVTGADRLVRIEVITRDDEGDTDRARMSYALEADLMRSVSSLERLAGHRGGSSSVSVPGVEAQHVDLTAVSDDYFRVLGMRLAAGRPFTPEEDRDPDGARVVVLAFDLAVALYGAAERAPGQPVLVNGLDFTVVGVAPPGFRGLKNDHFPQMFVPGATRLSHTPQGRPVGFEELIGRLADDASLERARAELTASVRALAETGSADNAVFSTAEVLVEPQPGMAFSSRNTRNEVVLMVSMIATAAALLLLLAGANVGNLLLFRAARRRDELALRRALGASRWCLVRANLIEVALLALAGGSLGLVWTFWLGQVFSDVVIPEAGFLTLPLDWRVGGVVLAAALLMAVVFGGGPVAIAAAGGDVAPAVARLGVRRGRRLRGSFTVMQLATSLSLLIGAVLLLLTVRNLTVVNVGIDPEPVVSARILLHDNGYDDARAMAFYRELLERASAMPGVDAVSVSGWEPLGGGPRHSVQLPGERGQSVSVTVNNVSSDYFSALGLPLLGGRTFSPTEALAPADSGCGPVVVSVSVADRLFGTPNAVGRAMTLSTASGAPECTVVGVVADVRRGPATDWQPTVYRPLARGILVRNVILARSSGAPAVATKALRETVSAIDPTVPLRYVVTLRDMLMQRMAGQRLISSVLGALAGMGLLMAAVGLYGLVAETVVDRAREFAIRTAIGAGPGRILLGVVRRAMRLALAGIIVGVALSIGLGQVLRSQLFGVTPLDPWVLLSAAGLLAAIVLMASLAPAIRATRVDPVEVLRAE
jgi:predicted permease